MVSMKLSNKLKSLYITSCLVLTGMFAPAYAVEDFMPPLPEDETNQNIFDNSGAAKSDNKVEKTKKKADN